MPVKFQFTDQRLQTWLLCHQTYDSVFKCEEAVFSKLGLTTQQHAVLISIRYIGEPVTVSDIANWLDRNPNGVGAIIDRMERDGLIKRSRDLRDRRAVPSWAFSRKHNLPECKCRLLAQSNEPSCELPGR